MLRIYISSIALIIASSSFISKQSITGKEIYEKNCARCHGVSGTKHFLGAKDLQKSIIDDSALNLIVENGKRLMPSYKKKMSKEEISMLLAYVKSLRK